MEPQTQQPIEDGGSNKAAGSSANMFCRRSSTRWIPTTDHIRILKDLFYNKVVRSPAIEQIQRICFQLKWYGKIEVKNVYFWFVNQRARERQKKRSTSDVHVPMKRSRLVGDDNVTNWKPEDQNINFGSSTSASASSAGVMTAFNGQMGNYGGYGSMNREIETLPLFPMHGEDMKTTSEGGGGYNNYSGGWGRNNDGSRISLELNLNSYGSTTSEGGGRYSYHSGGWGGYHDSSRISLELSLNSYSSTREGVFSAREETKL